MVLHFLNIFAVGGVGCGAYPPHIHKIHGRKLGHWDDTLTQ
jgi:hypothetical protein